MKILFLSHIWPPAVDGGSQIIYQTKKHLQKLGHLTMALTTNCFSTDDFVVPKSKIVQVKSSSVIRLPVYKTKFFIYLYKFFLFFNLKFYFLNLLKTGPVFKLIPLVSALVKIKQFKPKLIIAGPLPTTISTYAYLLAKLTKSKLVILPCFHPEDLSFQNKILLHILKRADIVWALSTIEKKYLSQKLNINSSKFFVSPPGINLEPLKDIPPKPKNFNILFLGNFAAHKKIEILIKAFSQINQRYPNTSLTIAGQKTLYYPQIEKTVLSLPPETQSNIYSHAKRYNRKQLKKLLDQSHLLVNPSIHESFGIVFIESLSRGVPIIGSNIPTVKNLIIQSKSGLYFEENNIRDLIDQITTLIDNKNLYKQLSQNGLKFSQAFRWSKIINRLNEKVVQI